MIERILHSPPWVYGSIYLSCIPIFGLIYLLTPSVLCGVPWFDNFYFSAVTITTLGYGDLLPVTGLGKGLASFQAVFGVGLIGLFLNALAERRGKTLNERKAQEAKKLLEMHVALVLEAAKTGNPFIWDKHAINSASLSKLVSFARELKQGALDESYKLSNLQIKAILEVANQNYETFLGLIPVASSIRPSCATSEPIRRGAKSMAPT